MHADGRVARGPGGVCGATGKPPCRRRLLLREEEGRRGRERRREADGDGHEDAEEEPVEERDGREEHGGDGEDVGVRAAGPEARVGGDGALQRAAERREPRRRAKQYAGEEDGALQVG